MRNGSFRVEDLQRFPEGVNLIVNRVGGAVQGTKERRTGGRPVGLVSRGIQEDCGNEISLSIQDDCSLLDLQ